MKKSLKTTLLVLGGICIITAGCISKKIQAQPAVGSFEVFYNDLAPFGQWIKDPEYGYVWVPDVEADFRPYYTNGYWVMTEYGNTWVSLYPWGWGPFHYGRWTFNSFYGWIWVPGYEWGPAWVAWRWGGGYYGWAPLAPGFVIGISFAGYYCPDNWWLFIPPHYLHHHHFHSYIYQPRRVRRTIKETTIINNTYLNTSNNVRYPTGPRPEEIKQVTKRDVPVYRVENISRAEVTAVEKEAVRIYRPDIEKAAKNIAPPHAIEAPRPIRTPESVNTRPVRPYKTESVPREPVIRQIPVPSPRPSDRPRQESPQREPRTPMPENRRPQPVPAPAPAPQRKPERTNRPPVERAQPNIQKERPAEQRNVPAQPQAPARNVPR